MHDERIEALSRYRLERSEAMLLSAKRDFDAEDYASANNRAYYCLFHAMRAVLALDSVDFKKHSAVIARFGQDYLKTDRISRAFGPLITTASLIRNRSDYEDFYICSIEETERLLAGADQFLSAVKAFLDTQV
ncbi:HEPN domain-containing protein [Eubacteriales bacterium OttesenSCG-928-A19]|nr:HEPN domain-containing protein [Eubacteriales bacterium OttesenSCG-928-A19]